MYVLARNILVLRKKRGLTQEELAKSIGVSKATISNYENDITRPSCSNLTRLADALGVEVKTLFEGTVPQTMGSNEIRNPTDSMHLRGDIPFTYIYTDENADTVIFVCGQNELMLFEQFSGGCVFTEINGKSCMVDTNSENGTQFMCGDCRVGEILSN